MKKTVVVYREKLSGVLSFWKEKERREHTPLWDFKTGLCDTPVEEFLSSLERVDISQYNFFRGRLFNFSGETLWIPIHFLRIRDQRGFRDENYYCLGCGFVVDVETIDLKGLLSFFERKTRVRVGPFYGVKIYPVEWEEFYIWRFPRNIKLPLKKGEPLSYPEGHYLYLGDDNDVIKNWKEVKYFLPGSFWGRKIHLLLYPDGCVCLTSGIPGSSTFWSRLQNIRRVQKNGNGGGW